MKKIRIALLASTAVIGTVLFIGQRGSITTQAYAQMAEFGGDRLIPLGFCAYSPTTASPNILNGSAGCLTGSFGTGASGTGASVIPALAKYAQVCVSGSNSGAAYYRDDGTVPTGVSGSGGMPVSVNGIPNCFFYAGNLSNFSIIQASGTVSVLLYAQP